MKRITDTPFTMEEWARMTNGKGILKTSVGYVRPMMATPNQEIDVFMTLYEKGRYWGLIPVKGNKPYRYLAIKIKEK